MNVLKPPADYKNIRRSVILFSLYLSDDLYRISTRMEFAAVRKGRGRRSGSGGCRPCCLGNIFFPKEIGSNYGAVRGIPGVAEAWPVMGVTASPLLSSVGVFPLISHMRATPSEDTVVRIGNRCRIIRFRRRLGRIVRLMLTIVVSRWSERDEQLPAPKPDAISQIGWPEPHAPASHRKRSRRRPGIPFDRNLILHFAGYGNRVATRRECRPNSGRPCPTQSSP